MAMPRSLNPTLLGRDWRDIWDFSPRLLDRHFDLDLMEDDLFRSTSYRRHFLRPRRQTSRQISTFGLSEVVNTKENFQALIDMSHFNPEDITVKMIDNCVIINGKHEEKTDQCGFKSREYTTKYILPEDVDPENVTSSLTSDGVLTIEAPKKTEQLSSNERVIPITIKETKSPIIKEQISTDTKECN